jgi:hypothetical protein
MSKIPAKIVNRQQERESKPSDSFEATVRSILKTLLPRKRRAELAAALTELMGREITKTMIDSWTAESKCQPRLPLSLAKALCQLIAAPALSQYLNTEEELDLIKIGEHARANKDLVARIASPRVRRLSRNK